MGSKFQRTNHVMKCFDVEVDLKPSKLYASYNSFSAYELWQWLALYLK